MDKNKRYEVRIAGTGGQGVILAAMILGKAAAVYSKDMFVVQTQSYGPEARGGASKAEVVFDKTEIDYPKVIAPNLQIILAQQACDVYIGDSAQNATIILDDFYIKNPPKLNASIYLLPIVKTAREELKREVVVNMISLGAAAKVLEQQKLLTIESIKQSIQTLVPRGTEDFNIKAFNLGYELMSKQ
ncbi:MAG: 2-oxoacid:ferredoxin oxidoreductase subunit gamma [Synergistaceae bacterium]|jgi:2-oxoglutarate ferredoxin oxidoreductase subunit gamma|nr:2-oxoacid:ferredoxin oxidoreductase subunit gamma [Synergistaceae bacterium]